MLQMIIKCIGGLFYLSKHWNMEVHRPWGITDYPHIQANLYTLDMQIYRQFSLLPNKTMLFYAGDRKILVKGGC